MFNWCCQFRYFTQRSSAKGFSQDKDDDVESVGSDDFEQYLADSAHLDFASEIKPKGTKDKKKKKSRQEEDDDDEEEEAGSESDLDAAENESEDGFDDDEDFKNAFADFDDMLNEDVSGVRVGAEGAEDAQDEDDDELGFREEDVEFSDGIKWLYVNNVFVTQFEHFIFLFKRRQRGRRPG